MSDQGIISKIITGYYPMFIGLAFVTGTFYNIGFSLTVGFEFFFVLTLTDHLRSALIPFAVIIFLVFGAAIVKTLMLYFKKDEEDEKQDVALEIPTSFWATLFTGTAYVAMLLGGSLAFTPKDMIDYSSSDTEYNLVRIVDNGRVLAKADGSIHYFSIDGLVKIKLTDHLEIETSRGGDITPTYSLQKKSLD